MFGIFKALSHHRENGLFFQGHGSLISSLLLPSPRRVLWEPHKLHQEATPLPAGRVNSGLAVVLRCSTGLYARRQVPKHCSLQLCGSGTYPTQRCFSFRWSSDSQGIQALNSLLSEAQTRRKRSKAGIISHMTLSKNYLQSWDLSLSSSAFSVTLTTVSAQTGQGVDKPLQE